MSSLFEGLHVLELAEGVSGPFCGKLFAGLGADVLKVEPAAGDRARNLGPFPGDAPDRERSGLFLHLNTGKRSTVLGEGAAATLDSLLAEADLVLLSGRPSELRARGLWPQHLVGRYPRLVVTNVSLFGLFGPNAEFIGDELIAYAASGYASLTGSPGREPLKAYGHLVHFVAGAHAALGSLAAIAARDVTGAGQVVDCSIVEAGTFLMGGVDQPAHWFGRVGKRNGTRLIGFPPQQPYPSTIRPCRDGYVHAHSNNRHLDLLGMLIPHARLQDTELLAGMSGHADEIDAIMDAWLAERDRADIVREAQELRLPFTEVMEPGEVMADPHHRARESFVAVEHPGAGPILQPSAPIRFHGTPWRTLPAPMLGSSPPEFVANQAKQHATTRVGPKPLSGVRILDFTNAIAGPISTCILADLGADVIKVEAPTARPRRPGGTMPLAAGATDDRPWDRIMIYNEVNHSKRSVALDVNTADGRALFLELVAACDVVVQNFSPRALVNMNLGYDVMRAARPDTIFVSMPAFGLSGPYRDRASYGPGVDAMSGLSHLTGYADGPPGKPGNFFCDQNAATLTAFATIAALRHRERTGEGQHIELSMIEGEFQILADAYIDFAMNGRERRRTGNDHAEWAPHGVFPCAGEDQWVAIACETDAHWQALCRAINRPDLAADSTLETSARRRSEAARLCTAIIGWTSSRRKEQCQERLQRMGVPAVAVLDAGDVLHDAHVGARSGFEWVETPNVGATPYPRFGFRLSRTPVPVAGPAPAFGSANREVVCGLLGRDESEYERLCATRVLVEEPSGAE